MDPFTIGLVVSAIASVAYNAYQSHSANEWNKSAQKTTWQREDNATQRRVADLRAAGLSPTLSAGSPAAAGSPIKIQGSTYDPAAILASMQYAQNFAKTDAEIRAIELQAIKTKADTNRTNAEAATKWHDFGIYNKTGTTSNTSGLLGQVRNLYDNTAIKKNVNNILNANPFKAIDKKMDEYESKFDKWITEKLKGKPKKR